MSILRKLNYTAAKIRGRFYVPPELINCSEFKIMHISDTPSAIYPALKVLLSTLRPNIVIHTGDLADDLKLEYDLSCRKKYEQVVPPFLHVLEKCAAEKIYLVPGNHDDKQFIKNNITRSEVLNEGAVIDIKGLTLGVAHKAKKLNKTAQYGLYGHNYIKPQGNSIFLNGLRNVNIMLCPSNKIVEIPYPFTVEYERKMGNSYGFSRTL